MRCPFPGMDPFIERTDIWPDFHDRLITFICSALQPLLRPSYFAVVNDRLYVVESSCLIEPRTVILEAEPTAIFEFWRDEVREPAIHIVDPNDQSRIITAIEVLSPANKTPGSGRDSYLNKRQEYWDSGTNLVEIDLLRAGKSTARIEEEKLEKLRPWDYLVLVTRHRPYRQEVYAFPLSRPIPRVAIPLTGGDRDVVLDLQSAFSRCWEEGPYPDLLRYGSPPATPLGPEQLVWSQGVLTKAGLTTPPA
ncbi:MAG TPA: DUF4058 family protein [Planctomycetaceae bacterium]|nr:DUF4058 family protein [Planctomycetaceae bacterium]